MYARQLLNSKFVPARRRGTATVEAAVTLPVLLVLVFGSIEAANAVFLKQALTIAAYEAGREATKPGGTAAAARTRCQEVLATGDIQQYTINFSPAQLDTLSSGDQVSVTVSVSAQSASLGPLWIFRSATMSRQVTMIRL